MRKKEFPDYCLGLDIGTNSVGWAAIDDGYELLKLCGKDAWGALLIDNAESAAGRRLARSARRRLERRRERIRLLRELFAPLIAPVDEKFFVRLDESSLHVGEGEFFRKNRYNIFDGEFTDKDYFRGKDTRTVYHLRRKLMESDEKADIRLVYLAVHHIVKYRGHFLLDGKAVDVGGNMLSGALDELFDLLEGDTYGKDMRCPMCLTRPQTAKNRSTRQSSVTTGKNSIFLSPTANMTKTRRCICRRQRRERTFFSRSNGCTRR